jgi:hypothetical protein
MASQLSEFKALLLGMAQNCSEYLLLLTLRILERLVQYDSQTVRTRASESIIRQ